MRIQCGECDKLGVFVCGICAGKGCDRCVRMGRASYVFCEACVFRAERRDVPVPSLEKLLSFMERNELRNGVMLKRNLGEKRIEVHATMNDDVGVWEHYDDDPGWI